MVIHNYMVIIHHFLIMMCHINFKCIFHHQCILNYDVSYQENQVKNAFKVKVKDLILLVIPLIG
ncbi:hypothetical protein Gogos_020292, partial [Gossypium gossypioides]|nr:hypothetical protein [Gossypium gossypioides]